MKRTMIVLLCLLLELTKRVSGQSSGWAAEFAGGAATPMSGIADRLSTGGDLTAGVGYKFNRRFVVTGEFGWANMPIPPDALKTLQAPDGHGRILSLSVEPELRFDLPKHLGGFVHGGVGWLHRTILLTEPTYTTTDYFDPYYGDVPQTMEEDMVLSSTSRDGLGVNFGGGVALPIADTGADVFVDVRYYHASTSPSLTAMLPVTIGVRYSPAK
jgi:hypothetical protein